MSVLKRRHGCLTAWLIFLIMVNSIGVLAIIVVMYAVSISDEEVQQVVLEYPIWVFPAMFIICIFDLGCLVALFRWKVWGFWGFLFSGVVALPVNLAAGAGPAMALWSSFSGPIFLAFVLNIGKSNKGWSQLE